MIRTKIDPAVCFRNPVFNQMLENVRIARSFYQQDASPENRYELCRREHILASAVELAGCR